MEIIYLPLKLPEAVLTCTFCDQGLDATKITALAQMISRRNDVCWRENV